jgi:Ca2+-binding EF-hand superfamily protein
MLTEFQRQKLPRLFSIHDLNGDGVITRRDFEDYAERIARTRGWGASSPQAKDLSQRFLTFWQGLEEVGARRGRKEVSLQDWLEYWDRILGNPPLYDQLIEPIARMVFTMLDRDGDGAVTESEYSQIYQSGSVDRGGAAEAFARLDLDHDGRLSVDEILTLADQFFRSQDPEEAGNALFGIVNVPRS